MGVSLQPITDEDLEAVGAFLHRHFNADISPGEWVAFFRSSPLAERPNSGFMLKDGEETVGVYGALYSLRNVRGEERQICNLTSWYVRPEYRSHSAKLALALLAQKRFNFTNFTPSPLAAAIFQRLKFVHLGRRETIAANTPFDGLADRARIVTDPERIDEVLEGRTRAIYRDHRAAKMVHHLAVGREAWCHLIYRETRRKHFKCAQILHASEPFLLARHFGRLRRHFLLRYGAPFTIAESHLLARKPRLALEVEDTSVRMHYSPEIRPDDIDYLYSERMFLTG